MINLIAQFLGLVGTTCSLLCHQQKGRTKLLFLYMSACFLFSVQLFMLGAITGAVLELVCVCMTLVSANKHKKCFSSNWWCVFFVTIMIISGILTWKDFWCIFSITASVLATIAVYMNSSKWIRIVSLTASPCYLTYALVSGAYTVVLNEILASTSIIIGMLRHDVKHTETKEAEVIKK